MITRRRRPLKRRQPVLAGKPDDADDVHPPPAKRRKRVKPVAADADAVHETLLRRFFGRGSVLLPRLMPKWMALRVARVPVRLPTEKSSSTATTKRRRRRKARPFVIAQTSLDLSNPADEPHLVFLRYVLLHIRPYLAIVSTTLLLFDRASFYVPLSYIDDVADLELVHNLHRRRAQTMDRCDYHSGEHIFRADLRGQCISRGLRWRIACAFHNLALEGLVRYKSARPRSIPKELGRDFTRGTQMRAIAAAFGEYASMLAGLRTRIAQGEEKPSPQYEGDVAWIVRVLSTLEDDASLRGYEMMQAVAGLDVVTHNLPARTV